MNFIISNSLERLSEITKSKLYLVGGFVRNYLLFGGTKKTDIDICGILPAEEIFPSSVKIVCVNRRLGTYKVVFMGEEFEYTPFRTEKYSKGHSPDFVRFGCDLKDDAFRRDFTVNAIYYDISAHKFIDPLNGIDDLKNKKIKMISDTTLRADGLRLLRALRFAAQFGFEIDKDTFDAICSNADLINDISPERIREELKKMLISDTAFGIPFAQYDALKMLKKSGLLKRILPELMFCDGVLQNPKYHRYDVLEHIFQVVKFSPSDIRLAALFHDIGKPHCIDSLGHMKGHDIIGAELTKTVMRRLRFSNAEISETSLLVRLHMFDLKGEASESKVKLFVVKNFEIIDKVIELKRADLAACGVDREIVYNSADKLQDMKHKVMSDGTPLSIKDLEINGEDLLRLGCSGKIIGEILQMLYRDCILMPRLNNKLWLMSRAEKMVKLYRV